MIEFKIDCESPATFGRAKKGDRKELGEKIEGDLIKAGLAFAVNETKEPEKISKKDKINKEKNNG